MMKHVINKTRLLKIMLHICYVTATIEYSETPTLQRLQSLHLQLILKIEIIKTLE